MNKIYLALLFLCFALIADAQNTAFKYQGVARNNQNASLNNQAISLRLTILNSNNAPVYSEQHMVTTSPIGLFSVNVCQGTNQNGNCDNIDWSKGGYQLKVDMDVNGGVVFAPMGTSPILQVPVAAYAVKAQSSLDDKDTDDKNEIQNLNLDMNNYNLSISGGNSVNLMSLKNDADADTTNELQVMNYDSVTRTLTLNKGGGAFSLPVATNLWNMNGPNILSYVNGNQSITFDKAGMSPLNQAYFELNFRPNAKHRTISGPSDWLEEFWTKPANARGLEIAYGSSVKEYPTTYAQHYLRFNADTFTRLRINNTLNGASRNSVSNEFLMLCQAYNGANPVNLIGVAMSAFEGIGSLYNAVGGRPGGTITAANVNNTVVPYVGVYHPTNSNTLIGGIYVSGTQSIVAANVKNFWMDHPKDPSKEIWYACVEGPEAAAYERGTANLVNGEAYVLFSDHFEMVVNPETMTIHLTPGSADSEGLAVIEKTSKGFKVKELRKGQGTYSFDWEVKGVRKGYEDYKVIRTKGLDTPTPVSNPTSFKEIEDAFKANADPLSSKGNK